MLDSALVPMSTGSRRSAKRRALSNGFVAAALLLVTFTDVAVADPIKSPQEQFAGHPTNIDDIPDGWITNNPIVTRICFNLRYPVNSVEADAFLREVHDTISDLEFAPKVQLERTIYPVGHDYCLSLTFRDWQHNRRYESDEKFLRFYHERWKVAVTEMQEQLTVLDQAAGGGH